MQYKLARKPISNIVIFNWISCYGWDVDVFLLPVPCWQDRECRESREHRRSMLPYRKKSPRLPGSNTVVMLFPLIFLPHQAFCYLIILLLSQTDTNSQNFYWHLNSFPVCFLNFLKAQCRYRRVAIKHKHIYLNFSSETYRHRHRILYWIIVQFNCLALNVTMSHSYFISHGVTVTCCIYNIIYTPSLQISNIFNKSYNCQILNWTSDSDETFDIWYFYWEIESYRKSMHQCIMYHNIICLTQQ